MLHTANLLLFNGIQICQVANGFAFLSKYIILVTVGSEISLMYLIIYLHSDQPLKGMLKPVEFILEQEKI